MVFEKLLKDDHPLKNTNYPLIQDIQIVFNKTRVDNEGNQKNVNLWHDDSINDIEEVVRQFVILLTPHLNTEFSIDSDKSQITNNYVHTDNIRRCDSTETGFASYWENGVIHRKPYITLNGNEDSRIIIAVIFNFTTNKVGNTLIHRDYHKDKDYYNSKTHLQKEVYALAKVFDTNITLPTKITTGGKKNPISCYKTESDECDNYWRGQSLNKKKLNKSSRK